MRGRGNQVRPVSDVFVFLLDVPGSRECIRASTTSNFLIALQRAEFAASFAPELQGIRKRKTRTAAGLEQTKFLTVLNFAKNG